MTQPVIFISYSHKDEREKDRLLSHLGVLQHQGLIGLWSDDRIGAGAAWEQEISEAMAQARVAILLISANFLTSDFILGKEVPALLKRRQSEGLTVFPVIAKACAWQEVDWLTEMNVRPKNGRPIWGAGSRRVNEDLAAIAKEVATFVKTGPQLNLAQKLPPPADLERYLRHVRDRQAILDFSIFQEGQERDFSNVPLDAFYIPLRLAGRLPDEEPPGEMHLTSASHLKAKNAPRSTPDEPYLLSTQLLAPDSRLGLRLALLGDAGSGKTTLLRQLTGALAQAWLVQDPGYARQRTGLEGELWLPLFAPLRYFHHYCRAVPGRTITVGSFFDFLPVHFQEQWGLALSADFYRALLASGRCLLALDGFDEVPDELSRRQVVELVRNLAADSELGRNMLILSSRVAAYGGSTQLGGSFQTLWVQPLNAEERAAQVRRWVEGIAPHTQRPLKADDILRRMPEDSPLDELAVTPMIVTTLCVVYFYDHELPEQRALLYRRCVDIMLHEKLRPDEPGQSLADQGGKPNFKRQLLARLAFEMHRVKKEGVNREQAARWLRDGFKNVVEEERLDQAHEFLDIVAGRGALLQERAGIFSFGRQHLTFREFLAGHHLILGLRPRERQPLWAGLLRDDRWLEPIRLAAGAAIFEATLTCEDFLHELLELADAPDADLATRLAGYKLAAESLWDLGQAGRALLDLELQTEIINGLVQRLFDDPAIADPAAGLLKERVAAAQVLGRLSDPRPGVITLPPLLTDPIEGEFLYGDEQKERLTVTPFQAGVYPVTNAQFGQFMKVGGYENPAWWSQEGLDWLKDSPGYRQQPVRQPEYWDDERFNNPNQPVVGVSWYEAEAFCNWLTAAFGRDYRLPTEAEWERLARGQEGWEYPWEDEWQEGLANTSEADLGQTTAIGLFPGGASPEGVYDCAGNVWEWCADWYDEEKTGRALRGGSWYGNQVFARCAVRNGNYPYSSSGNLGFRVVSPIK